MVDEALAPPLGEALKDPDKNVRAEAALTLGFMGEAASEQSPRIADLLSDPLARPTFREWWRERSS